MPDKTSNAKTAAPRLANKVALVTGGAGGIGEAIVTRLASEGALVAIVDVDEVGGQRIAHSLSLDGADALFVHCDVTRREQVRSAVETVETKLGPIRILVNNAGIGLRAPFLNMTDDTWNTVVGNGESYRGVYRRSGSVPSNRQEWWRERRQMASTAAQIANSEQVVYSVTKAGLEAMTRVMAFELAPLGVRVNAVAPGTIATDFLSGMLTQYAKAERVRRIPLGHFGNPDEVARVVAFLVSEDAQNM